MAGGWDSLDVTDNIRNMQPLLTDGAGIALAAAGRFGSGGIVVTSGAVGADIADWTNDGIHDPDVTMAPDVMFGYNVMAWATGWTQGRQSPRSAGASLGEVWADLDVKWQSHPRSLDMGPVAGAPVVDDIGRMFVATYGLDANVQPMLYCFDADPARDLDRDGAADDGQDDGVDVNGNGVVDNLEDYAGVDSVDLIWKVDLGNYTSRSTSPAAATMVDSTGALWISC